jgi:hypothetical protein
MDIRKENRVRVSWISLMLISMVLIFSSMSKLQASARPTVTEVGGPIISDTTWILEKSPYVVTSNVQVLTDVELTIEPGVVIKFQPGKLLQIDGTLIASGNATNSITFTSNQIAPEPGDWVNIKFTDSSKDAVFDSTGNYISGSILRYCIIEFGGDSAAAIETKNASPLIDHCTVRNNKGTGILGSGTESTPIVISNNSVVGNGWLFEFGFFSGGGINASHAKLIGNYVNGNATGTGGGKGGGIHAAESVIEDNIVSNNSNASYGGGISASNSVMSNNTIINNSGFYGGGIFARNSTIENNLIGGNSSGNGGGIYAGEDSKFHGGAVVNNTIRKNTATYNGGGIVSNYGTVTNNIVFENTANEGGGIRTNSSLLEENIIDSNSAVIGGGVYAYYSTMTGNTIKGNSVTVSGQGSGVLFYGLKSHSFLYNTVIDNAPVSTTSNPIGGLVIQSYDQIEVHYNNLYGNSPYDVVVEYSKDVNGIDNYWGTVSNVDILTQIFDWYDESSRGKFLFIPYLQDPDPSSPVPPPGNLTAILFDGTANLSWDAIPSTAAGYGYKVYYDNDLSGPPYVGTGLLEGNSPIDVSGATSFSLNGLAKDSYFMAVTAYDTLGRESWYSNEVSFSNLRYMFLPVAIKND